MKMQWFEDINSLQWLHIVLCFTFTGYAYVKTTFLALFWFNFDVTYTGINYYSVWLVAVVDSSPVSCGNGTAMKRAERCLSPFQQHLEKGVAEFASLSDSDVADACLWVTWLLCIDCVWRQLTTFRLKQISVSQTINDRSCVVVKLFQGHHTVHEVLSIGFSMQFSFEFVAEIFEILVITSRSGACRNGSTCDLCWFRPRPSREL